MNNTAITQPNTIKSNENIRIIIIDDSAANLILAKAALLKAGFDVHTAKSGLEGLALLQQQPAHLILLDLSMPDIDGFDVLDRLRAERKGPNLKTKAVALTAHTTPEMRSKVSDKGFDGYLSKPIKPDELISAANNFLKR